MIATEFAVLTGQKITSASVDNAAATATVPAKGSGSTNAYRNYLVGFIATYSAAVSAVKNITISYTDLGDTTHEGGNAQTEVIPWDFSNGSAIIALPGVLACHPNTAATFVLDASGTGGTTGKVSAYYFTK